MTCQNCGAKNHPGLKKKECPFTQDHLQKLDYNKVLSMLSQLEFNTSNTAAIRIRLNFLANLPTYSPNKSSKSNFPTPDKIDSMGYDELSKWCYFFGIEEANVLSMKKALKMRSNMDKMKNTPRGPIKMNFVLACSLEGNSDYDHIFHLKDETPNILQTKLGGFCGYVHGSGKKCGGKIVSRSIAGR
jgi:hypothetical protein